MFKFGAIYQSTNKGIFFHSLLVKIVLIEEVLILDQLLQTSQAIRGNLENEKFDEKYIFKKNDSIN